MKKTNYLLIISILLLYFTNEAQSAIARFKSYQLGSGKFYSYKQGMYSEDEAPSKSGPSHGRSFVTIELNITKNDPQNFGQIGVFLYSTDGSILIGSNKDNSICCTKELMEEDGCDHVGDIIQYESDNLTNVEYFSTIFSFDNSSSDSSHYISEFYNITVSSMYTAHIVNCGWKNDATINGRIVFLNPFGYLNGELYALLPFFGALAMVYLVLAFVWCVYSIKFRKQLLKLQNAIAFIILLGFVETAINCFDYLGYNNSGINFVGAMIVGVLISTVKKSLSRILVLVVSLGYGVVKPSLGDSKKKVIIYAVMYTVFSGILNVVDLVQRTSSIQVTVLIFLIFPVAALDTGFYWWIFLSMLRTIQQLSARKQSIKLSMYKRFLGVLAFSGVLSAIVIVGQLIVMSTTISDATWKFSWIWSAFWHVLYLMILVAIMIIWVPTSNNSRYAYSEFNNEGEEITLEPLGVGDAIQRKKSELEVNEKEKPASKELKKVDSNSTINDLAVAFSIDDEDKEPPDSKLD